jgi:hypothetical protein
VLPPLRTPHHPLPDRTENLTIGEYREGVVTSSVNEGSLVDIGVEHPLLIPNKHLSVNSRVTVRVTELGKHPKATLVNRKEIKTYWGYRVTTLKFSFGQLLKNRVFDLVVATSRHGASLREVKEELARQWKSSRRTLVAFGAPAQGLYEIVARESLNLDEIVHFTINTVPSQGTETVRTEEAIYASLAALNLLDDE